MTAHSCRALSPVCAWHGNITCSEGSAPGTCRRTAQPRGDAGIPDIVVSLASVAATIGSVVRMR